MKIRIASLFSMGLLAAATSMNQPVYAASVTGKAVGGVNNIAQVGIANAQGVIDYFIPLSGANSGVYGVTPVAGGIAGTFSDSGSGYGYNDPNNDALQMYLRYDLSQLDVPASTATLSFRFDDLDLSPFNDPNGFFEDIQFHYYDGTNLNLLTHTVLDVSDSVTLVDAAATMMADPGDNNRIHVLFPSLAPILNALPSGSDAFYIRLDFSSQYTSSASNTAEHLLSSVLTTTVAPLPSAAWLGLAMMGGMGAVGKIRRKRLTA